MIVICLRVRAEWMPTVSGIHEVVAVMEWPFGGGGTLPGNQRLTTIEMLRALTPLSMRLVCRPSVRHLSCASVLFIRRRT